MKRGFFKKIVASVLAIANIFTIIPVGIFANEIDTVESAVSSSFNFVNNGSSFFGDVFEVQVGNFSVSDFQDSKDSGITRQAFCADNSRETPTTGTTFSNLHSLNNESLARVLYYGWFNPSAEVYGTTNPGHDEKVVVTSTAFSQIYANNSLGNSGDVMVKKQALIDIANNSNYNVPNNNISLTKSDLNVSVSGNKQITETTKLNGYTGNTISFNVPDGITLVNETKGNQQITNSTATITVGDEFHFEADLAYSGSLNTGNLYGSLYDFKAFIAESNSDLQDIATYGYVENRTPVSLTATFTTSLGTLRITKESEYGVVEGVKFQIKSKDIEEGDPDFINRVVTTGNGGIVNVLLKPGTYEVTELEVPNYAVPQETKTVTVEESGTTDQPQAVKFENILKRGNVKVVKTADDNVIENVTFKLSGTSDQGSAVEVISKTNSEGIAEFNNIPIGTYTLSEENQEDRYVNVADSTQTVEWNVTKEVFIENKLKAGEIGTKAKDSSTNNNYAYVSTDTTIIDTVSYEGLAQGETYVIKGTIMDKKTGRPLVVEDGEVVASKRFVASNTGEGTVDVEFTFDSTDLKGKSIVVFEECSYISQEDGTEHEVASHKNINDIGQTITFKDPSISTTAKDTLTDLSSSYVQEESTIIDTVRCKGLIPNTGLYQLKCDLVDSKTGNQIEIDGRPVSTVRTFTADSEEVTVDVKIDVDTSSLRGKSVVCFEQLYFNNKLIAEHKDINDKGQTVTYKNPGIKTTIKDKDTEIQEAYAQTNTTLIDTVSYTGLIKGKKYKVSGILMDKETNEALLIKGKEVVATKEFTAEKENGTIDIEFIFDSTGLTGKKIVAFEYLDYEGVEIATHTDINDEGQTITYKNPDIKTTIKDKDSRIQEAYTKTNTTLIDTVSYTGLIKGKKYKVSGVLMNKETNEPLLVKGKEVVATKEFTADEENGTIDIEFVFDSTGLTGKEIVAFEYLDYEGIEIATHADINDKDQTIKFIPGELPKTGGKMGVEISLIILSVITVGAVVLFRNRLKKSKNN